MNNFFLTWKYTGVIRGVMMAARVERERGGRPGKREGFSF
jgi:hypothetical protein